MTVCYLCNKPIDGSTHSKDHVIPKALSGKVQPKRKGFHYAGTLPTHPDCNNRFGDEVRVRQAMRLLGALYDPNTTLTQPAPGYLNGRVLALNEKKLVGFSRQDLRFFGIHDARKDSVASFADPEYLTDKPHFKIRKVLCIVLSVLTKSAAAHLFSERHLDIDDIPSKWNVVCVPYAGDATGIDLSKFFGEPRLYQGDIRVWTKPFEGSSWVSIYATKSTMVFFFFLMSSDSNLVEGITQRFHLEDCLQFQGESLVELVGHDWPVVVRQHSPTTMRETMKSALRTLTEEPLSVKEAHGIRGSGWEGNLDEMRRGHES